MQQFGTGAIGYLFSPVLFTWCLFICGALPCAPTLTHRLPCMAHTDLLLQHTLNCFSCHVIDPPLKLATERMHACKAWVGKCGGQSLLRAVAQILARRAGVGLYNIVRWDWTILRAVSPHYWVLFLVRKGQGGWRLLGSIVLCITGAL